MLSPIDIVIVFLWLVVIFAIGMIAGLKENVEGFWINNRKTNLLPLVLTIVSTQVGAGTIVGITSSTFSSGTGFGLVAVVSTVTGFIAIAFIAPWLKRFGDKYQALTLPEIFKVRYGRQAQVIASLIIIFTYISLLAGQYIALAHLVNIWTAWDIKLALLVAVGGLVVYTSFAGIKGDIATDKLHFWMMLFIIFFVMTPSIASKVDISESFSKIPMEIWSPVTFGGYVYIVVGILLGAIIPLVSMELWMRVYASVDERQAKQSFVISAALVIPFHAIAMLFGLIAVNSYPSTTNADSLLFSMMIDNLPTGLLGLGIGAIIAVVLSSANTMIVVIGATFFKDILNKSSVDEANLRFSRTITAIVGVIGAIYAFFIPDIVQLMLNAFFVIAVLAPSLYGVAFWQRATQQGSSWSLALGSITTIVFLFVIPRQAFLPGLIIALLSFIVVSLMTKHSAKEITERHVLFGHKDAN